MKIQKSSQDYLEAMLPGFKMIVRVMQGDAVPYDRQIADMQQVVSRVITREHVGDLPDVYKRQGRRCSPASG